MVERDHIMRREKATLLMKVLDEMESSRSDILARLEEMRLTLRMREEAGEPVDGASLEAELAVMQARKSALEAELTEKKVAIASLQGGRERSREELRGLAEMETQFRELVSQRQREIAESAAESASLDTATQEERSVVLARLEEERLCQAELDESGGRLEERRAAIDSLEGELKTRAAERARIFERQNEVKIALSTIDTKMRDIVEKAQEMYGADLSCYLEGLEMPLTDEEAAVTREMLDREKRKLEGIGPVNLAAVEEFKEKKGRLDFLEGQKNDLAKAREELTEAITTINKRARSQFLETFELVRGHFRETFEVLFEGGEADLSLGEGSDPLEADVIITARPKGKRLQDIALLSGGERALTALALLFALYKAKPSPFCIFDEVDAPLDDANIQRFVRMLKRFSVDTQFIIITHNKRTMEAADTLYGVTMEERGVSRIVSVDLAGIEDLLRRKAPAPDRGLVQTPVSQN